ncbi:MAG: hypothetical protein R3279_11080 [Putridiphycobacter sp.]|nr:hypothetical protein [Putridiphycobacter sp.]
MKNRWILIALLMVTNAVSSQIKGDFEKRQKDRKNGKYVTQGDRGKAIYSHSRSHYRPFGWHASAGITYMFGNNSNTELFEVKPAFTIPGYYLEGGFAHLFKQFHKVFHYIDYGVGIKHYAGSEIFTDVLGESIRGNFNFGSAFGRFGIHSVWQLSEWNWIDQSIGANVDYRIYGGKIDSNYPVISTQDFQEKLVGQIHYSIGWGYKPREGLYFIPTLQTPILTAVNWRNFNPGTRWFSTKYQPVIFMVKMGVLFPKKGCPKVFSKDAQRQSDAYQNR